MEHPPDQKQQVCKRLFLNNNFEKVWRSADVNNDGKIKLNKAYTFEKSLMGSVRGQIQNWDNDAKDMIEKLNMQKKGCMEVRAENGVYVFDVELDDDEEDVITLDSGAGCSAWPRGRHAGSAKMLPKKKGVGMVAANATPIAHHGQRQIRFRGVQAENKGFTRPM